MQMQCEGQPFTSIEQGRLACIAWRVSSRAHHGAHYAATGLVRLSRGWCRVQGMMASGVLLALLKQPASALALADKDQ